jgi:lipoprotein NlpI
MKKVWTTTFLMIALALPACSYVNRDIKQCYESTDPDLAVKSCTAVIESGNLHGQGLTDMLIHRGVVYERKGDYDKAIQDYDSAIDSNPNLFEAYYNRGRIYEKKGEHDRAIRDFDQAIQINPSYVNIFIIHGVANENIGEYDQAIQDYNQAIKHNPSNATAFYNRANAYRSKGEHDQAIQDYNQAIRLKPNYANAYNNRGNAYRSNNQLNLALKDYDEAIRLDPADAVKFKSRGITRFLMGQFPAAHEDLTTALKLNPDDPYSAIWMFLVQTRLGQQPQSTLKTNAAALNLKVWPGQVISLFMGDMTKEALLSSAQDPDPKKEKEHYCEAYFYLGEDALRQGKLAEAKSLFDKAIQTQVTSFFEYTGAQVELKRLNP